MWQKTKDIINKILDYEIVGLRVRGFVVLILFIIIIRLVIKAINLLLEALSLHPLSFWIGLAIPSFVALFGGLYVVMDNLGFFKPKVSKNATKKSL